MPSKPFRSEAEALAFADSLSPADAEDWLEAIEDMKIEYRQRIAAGETIRTTSGQWLREVGHERRAHNRTDSIADCRATDAPASAPVARWRKRTKPL